MTLDVTYAFLLVAALQLIAIAMLGYLADHARPRVSKRGPLPLARVSDAAPMISTTLRPHRHVWTPRSEEMTQGKRIRVSVCADCPDILREEVG